jgi:hypothetical protein
MQRYEEKSKKRTKKHQWRQNPRTMWLAKQPEQPVYGEEGHPVNALR